MKLRAADSLERDKNFANFLIADFSSESAPPDLAAAAAAAATACNRLELAPAGATN